jgi:hypothetical protein
MFKKRQQRGVLLYGMLLWGALSTSWALAESDLTGIALSATPVETKIVLQSRGGIPYQIISQSSDKIVIDLSSVDPTQSVQTDFTSADNIEQVILKPAGNDKLRMIIRGERLAPPAVESENQQTKPLSSEMVFQQESSGGTGSTKSVQTTPSNTASSAMVQVPSDNNKAIQSSAQGNVPNANVPSSLQETGNPSTNTFSGKEPTLLNSGNSSSEKGTDRPSLVDLRRVASTESPDENESSWTDSLAETLAPLVATVKKAFAHFGNGWIFPFFGLTGIFILLGLFIRHKLSQTGPHFEEEEIEIPTGPGFWARLFGGGRREKRILPTLQPDQPRRRTRYESDTDYRASRHSDRPVGLSSFNHNSPAVRRQSSLPEIPPPTPSRQHALNQYSKNAMSPLAQQKPRSREELDMEMKRSIQMREAIRQTQTHKSPSSRMGTAPIENPMRPSTTRKPMTPPTSPMMNNRMGQFQDKTKAGQPEPAGLPANNNEVLDFLRSVADLMEKDGKPQLANGVKKGMGQSKKQ